MSARAKHDITMQICDFTTFSVQMSDKQIGCASTSSFVDNQEETNYLIVCLYMKITM